MKATINNSLFPKLKPQLKYYDVWDDKLGGFHLRVNPNGKIVYRCLYTRGKIATLGRLELLTPAQARDKAKQILGEAAVGIYSQVSQRQKIAKPSTFSHYVEGSYAEWRLSNRKHAKEDLVRLKINFLKSFGEKPLSDITPFLVEQWCSRKLAKGRKASTVNRDITILKSALAKVVEWGFLENNPLTTLKPIKVDKVGKVRYLDKEEVVRLRCVLDEREAKLMQARNSANQWRTERDYPELSQDCLDYMKPLILLSINTGMRRGEILNLTWKNVDLAAGVLTIAGETAKSGRTRHIPLNSEALMLLQQWKERVIATNALQEWVFFNKNGNKLQSVKKAWARILKLAKIENFRWHDLRHHFASRLAMGGIDLNTIRELLGHADIQMTLRYAHLAPQHKAKAVAVLLQ